MPAPRPKPYRVTDFNQFVYATGGRPLLRVGDSRLVAGRFDIAATLTDNVIIAADLGLASVWDKRVQTLYGNAAAKLEAVFRIGAVRIYINDPLFTVETQALRAELENKLYLHMVRSSQTMDIPLRGHVAQAFRQPAGLTTAQLALTEDRATLQGAIRRFERPFQVDLKTDQFVLATDSAVNFASAAGIAAYVQVWGHLAPRDYPGAMVSDSDTCGSSAAGEAASVGPADFPLLTQAGFGGDLLDGPDQIWGV